MKQLMILVFKSQLHSKRSFVSRIESHKCRLVVVYNLTRQRGREKKRMLAEYEVSLAVVDDWRPVACCLLSHTVTQ